MFGRSSQNHSLSLLFRGVLRPLCLLLAFLVVADLPGPRSCSLASTLPPLAQSEPETDPSGSDGGERLPTGSDVVERVSQALPRVGAARLLEPLAASSGLAVYPAVKRLTAAPCSHSGRSGRSLRLWTGSLLF